MAEVAERCIRFGIQPSFDLIGDLLHLSGSDLYWCTILTDHPPPASVPFALGSDRKLSKL